MTGRTPIRPTLGTVRALLDASHRLGDPFGAVVELCVTSLCLPWEAVAVDLATIDWAQGAVPVPARGGTYRMLHLPPPSLRVIARLSATAIVSGQALTGGTGRPLSRADVRLDRIKERLAAARDASAALGDWNMHGLRAAAADELLARGSTPEDVAAALGLATSAPVLDAMGATRTGRADFQRAVATIGRWNAILAEKGEGMTAPARARGRGP